MMNERGVGSPLVVWCVAVVLAVVRVLGRGGSRGDSGAVWWG
jgi:hypothetical protein